MIFSPQELNRGLLNRLTKAFLKFAKTFHYRESNFESSHSLGHFGWTPFLGVPLILKRADYL